MSALLNQVTVELKKQIATLQVEVALIEQGEARFEVRETSNHWVDRSPDMAHRLRNVLATYEAVLIAVGTVQPVRSAS